MMIQNWVVKGQREVSIGKGIWKQTETLVDGLRAQPSYRGSFEKSDK